MKRTVILFATLLIFFFPVEKSHASGLEKKVSLKFSVGYGKIPFGDLNNFSESFDDRFDDMTADWLGTKRGEFKQVEEWGTGYGAELLLNLSPNWKLSFGLGYTQRIEGSLLKIEDESIGSLGAYVKPKIVVYTYSLNLYFFLPITSSLKVFFNPGAVLYYGRVNINFWTDYDEPGVLAYTEDGEVIAKSRNFGYQCGIGLEFSINSFLSLYIEGKGRSGKLNSWKGWLNYTLYGTAIGFEKRTASGTPWYCEQYDPGLNEWYTMIKVSDDIPTSPEFRNVRELEFSLTGFSVLAGIRIKL
ncbi:MAG: hypothetical protein PVI11_05970 [Candidatus Aminicenantes bacterium]|jgi:hypothetical protein